jgi:hypothetical protein
MFDRREVFLDFGERWAIVPAIAVQQDQPNRMSAWTAASMVDRWCDDARVGPLMHRLFEEVSDSRLRSPTSSEIEQFVKPTLRRAFEVGALVVVQVNALAERRAKDEGVHIRQPPRSAEEPKSPPRRIVEPPPDLRYLYRVKVIDDTGAPVASLALKLDIEGTPRSLNTDVKGEGKVEWSSGPPAKLELRDMPSVAKRMQPRWRKPRSKELPKGGDVYEVEVGTEFVPLSIKPGALTTIILARRGVRRVRMVGMLFDANKCFPLPEGLPGVRTVVALHRERPKAKVLIVGHAESDETHGGPDLAVARAGALGAYLTNKPKDWLSWFGSGKPEHARWGLREVQLMLSALSSKGTPLYEGYASGVRDEKTTAAVKEFQKSKNLKDDGKGGPDTLKALVTAYMGIEDTSLSRDIVPVVHGCAGHFDDTATDDGLQPDDRRLEVFFFDDEIDPKPAGKSSAPGSAEYPAWRAALVETRDFEHHGIHVQIVDADKQPVPLAETHLEGPTTGDAVADDHGFVSFFDLVAGEYTLSAKRRGFKIGTFKLAYPTAKTVQGYRRSTTAESEARKA